MSSSSPAPLQRKREPGELRRHQTGGPPRLLTAGEALPGTALHSSPTAAGRCGQRHASALLHVLIYLTAEIVK